MDISHHLLSTHHTKSNAIPVKTVNCNAKSTRATTRHILKFDFSKHEFFSNC
jgi:hypothetical protein